MDPEQSLDVHQHKSVSYQGTKIQDNRLLATYQINLNHSEEIFIYAIVAWIKGPVAKLC